MKWRGSSRAPSSVHEFVAKSIESSRFPVPAYPCERHRSPLLEFDLWPMHLAIICCAFDDEPAFDRAARLAVILTSHSVPTVMVGRPRDGRSVAATGRPNSCSVNLGSVPNFRLFRVLGPPNACDRAHTEETEGSTMASAASVFVNFVWSASLIGSGLFDFYDQLFRAKRIPRGISGETNGWPIVSGEEPAGGANLPFLTDRWAVVSLTVPIDRGMGSLRGTLIGCLRERRWPDHRWSPVYVSVGSRLGTTLEEYRSLMWHTTEPGDCLGDDLILGHTRVHTGQPDRLSLQVLAVQLPDAGAAAA